MKKIMAKVSVFAMALVMVLSLSSCGRTVKDGEPAILEITSSTGDSDMRVSWNDSRAKEFVFGGSGISRARLIANEYPLYLKDGETAHVRFYCSSCEYEEQLDIQAPFSHLFECKCPKGKEGLIKPTKKEDSSASNWTPHQREYVALVTTNTPPSEKEAAEK